MTTEMTIDTLTTTTTTADDALRLTAARKSFGSVRAVDDVDLTVADHEVLALVGPSGCGKSTLLRLVAGLTGIDSGQIRIGSDVVDDGSRRAEPEHRHVGLVFQEHALFPHLTVADNVTFGLRSLPRAERANRRDHWLAVVGLGGHGDRYPHELSGGERQRVALARALAPQPRLILLDEPFASLDPNLRTQIRADVLAVLRSTGTAALFVTHDQVEALATGDRIAVMRGGRIEQAGTPVEVFHEPRNRFVAEFMGEANLLPLERAAGSGSSAGSGSVGSEGSAGSVAGVGVVSLAGVGAGVAGSALPGAGADAGGGAVSVVITELGPVEVAADAPGSVVVVRPSELAVVGRAAGEGVPATVVASEFRGSTWSYGLQLASGRVVRATLPVEARFSPGDAVCVAVRRGVHATIAAD